MVAQVTVLLGVLTLGLLSPGPDFFVVVRNSVGSTRAHALATVAGIVVGLAVHTSLIAFGVAALPEHAMRVVSLAGAGFLAWLGVRALFSSRDVASAAGAGTARPSKAAAHTGFVEGLLCNLTNPKAFFFFVSVFAQVVPVGVSTAWRVALPVIVVVHAAVLWSAIVFAVQSAPVAARLARVQRWLPACFGVALLVFAALVVIEAFA